MIDRRAIFDVLYAGSPHVRLSVRLGEGVVVPAWLLDRPAIVLDLGWGLARPTHDIQTDEHGIRVTLSFGGAPFPCEIPWPSVFMVVAFAEPGNLDSSIGMAIWPDASPAEPAAEEPPVSAKKPRPSHLQLVR